MKGISADTNTGERRRSSRIKQRSATPVSTQGATPQSSVRERTPIQSVQKSVEQDTPGDEISESEGGSQKRKRDIDEHVDPLDESWTPLTDENRKSWKGWVELESEPALFNFLLKEYGVKCVKIHELFGLDDESLATLPSPIYGMVFLFKYRAVDAQEDPDALECPDHVWFANQTTENACATVALMNIVMNISEIGLGPELEAFKKSTQNLDPVHRGQRLGMNEFIRGIHNSFLRRSDILAADLYLEKDYQEWERQTNAKHKVAKTGRKKRIVVEDSEAYHFIAYVPVAGEVWKLDGLQREPTCIGRVVRDWVSVARDNIMTRIQQFGETGNIDYVLQALTKCPIGVVLTDISRNLLALTQVESALEGLVPDWKLFIESENKISSVSDLRRSFNLSEEDVANAELLAAEQKKIASALYNPEKLLNLYKSLSEEHHMLSGRYMEEISSASQDQDVALQRKRDDTPLVYQAVKALADAGVLRDLVEAIHGQ